MAGSNVGMILRARMRAWLQVRVGVFVRQSSAALIRPGKWLLLSSIATEYLKIHSVKR